MSQDRVTELEVQLAHVQRLYEQLNEVVTAEAIRADRLQRQVELLSQQIRNMKAKTEPAESDPLDERPPHY